MTVGADVGVDVEVDARPGTTVRWRVHKVVLGEPAREASDTLATEEPLEIRLNPGGGSASVPVSVTMRTPGHDFELAAGFLFTEGIVDGAGSLGRMEYCVGPVGVQQYNTIGVFLRPGTEVDLGRLTRHFYTSSSCGVCGKASLDALVTQQPEWARDAIEASRAQIEPPVVVSLPETLRGAQSVFDRTGGLHAAGLFDMAGKALLVREDVGRHNALDKLIGARLLGGLLPGVNTVLTVSGRASFELVQKAGMAGIAMMVAVGAPSSLAVETAESLGITLAGFTRGERFNVYSHPHRITGL